MEKSVPFLREILAANIKEHRKKLGISQEKLAEMAGLSWQTVNSIECHRTWVSDKTLEAIAKTLNTETFQLLMPAEIRTALSEGKSDALLKLADAKKTYDDVYNKIFNELA